MSDVDQVARVPMLADEREHVIRRANMLDDMRHDLRAGVRQFTRDSMVTVVAVLTLALAAGVLAGLMPALQFSRPHITNALKAGAREGEHRRSAMRSAATAPCATVVGVSENSRGQDWIEDPIFLVHVPLAQAPAYMHDRLLVVRPRGAHPERAIAEVRRAMETTRRISHSRTCNR